MELPDGRFVSLTLTQSPASAAAAARSTAGCAVKVDLLAAPPGQFLFVFLVDKFIQLAKFFFFKVGKKK
jgi:hypothetical protein